MHNQSKVFGHAQKFLFLILKGLFLMKQVKHHNGFIYYTKYKFYWDIVSKVGDRSRGRPEGSYFNSYYTEV